MVTVYDGLRDSEVLQLPFFHCLDNRIEVRRLDRMKAEAMKEAFTSSFTNT